MNEIHGAVGWAPIRAVVNFCGLLHGEALSVAFHVRTFQWMSAEDGRGLPA